MVKEEDPRKELAKTKLQIQKLNSQVSNCVCNFWTELKIRSLPQIYWLKQTLEKTTAELQGEREKAKS